MLNAPFPPTPGADFLVKPQPQWLQTLDYDFIAPNMDGALLKTINSEAIRIAKELRVRVHVRSFDAICKMVAHGLGVSILPRSSTPNHVSSMPFHIVELADRWAMRRDLSVGWRPGSSFDALTQEFLNKLIKH